MFKWDTALKEDALDKPVKIVSAKGEYEAAGFLVRSKFNVKGFIPTPSDLKGDRGDTLPASVLDLRIAQVMARYVSSSSKLVAFEPVPLVPVPVDSVNPEHAEAITATSAKTKINAIHFFIKASSFVFYQLHYAGENLNQT